MKDVPLIEAEYTLDAVGADTEVAAALKVKQRSPIFRIEFPVGHTKQW